MPRLHRAQTLPAPLSWIALASAAKYFRFAPILSAQSTNHRAEREAVSRQREEEQKARQQECEKNQETTRSLLDEVLNRIPKVLARADYEMLLFAVIERLNYEDWEALTERYQLDTDEKREPDAAAFELRKVAESATDSQLIRMLFELALLPFGYSDEQ